MSQRLAGCRVGVDRNNVSAGLDIGSVDLSDQVGMGIQRHSAPRFVVHRGTQALQFRSAASIQNHWAIALEKV